MAIVTDQTMLKMDMNTKDGKQQLFIITQQVTVTIGKDIYRIGMRRLWN